MQRLFFLLLLLGILCPGSWASTPTKHPFHRKTAPVRPHPQVPFSFIPPYQPSTALRQLKSPLTGRVVQTQPAMIPSQPVRPKYTQIFLTPAQLAALTPAPSVKPSPPPKRWTAWHWSHVDYAARSWVTPLNSEQAKTLASSITNFLVREMPPESTTLLLAIPSKSQAHNPLTEHLTENLRRAGFALVDRQQQASQAQLVRYEVSQLDSGFWVKLQLPNLESNRFYTLTPDNQIMAASPFTVRSLSK